MTTTQNLYELATDPQAFDTKLAELHHALDCAREVRDRAVGRIHRGIGDRTHYARGRSEWGLSERQAVSSARGMVAAGESARGGVDLAAELANYDGAEGRIMRELADINEMDDVYSEYRWTRFFPSVTKSQPHIHRSLSCRTLHPTTVMRWEPALSGKTDEQAVADLDEALCSVCFPDAPVALHNYVSRKSTEAQAQRAAEKLARNTAKFAKILADGEQFRTQGRFGERITTVAACKELIRKAVELEIELEYWQQVQDGTRSAPGWSPENLARRLANTRDSLVAAKQDSDRAQTVLIAREMDHPGWGVDAVEIGKMVDRKDKSARKDWGL